MTTADEPRSPSGARAAALDQAVDAARAAGTFAVLTGAGVSTDSGIPDYRGEGAPKRTPMTFQQFLADDTLPQALLGRQPPRLAAVRRRAARTTATARSRTSRRRARANGVITQNVDGLHTQAGSRRVVDLHGSMDRVLCLVCGQIFAREAIAERIEAANPWLDTGRRGRDHPGRRRDRRPTSTPSSSPTAPSAAAC